MGLRRAFGAVWAGGKDDHEIEKGKQCVVKVMVTGIAEDGPDWQPHVYSTERGRQLANGFNDARDPLRFVTVQDKWLTGFAGNAVLLMHEGDRPSGIERRIAIRPLRWSA